MKRDRMRLVIFGLVLVLAAFGGSAVEAEPKEKGVILFDFEEDTQGWKVDWATQDKSPQLSATQAHQGKKSIAYVHRFKGDQQAIGGVVTFEVPKNVTGFKQLSGWVYLPEHSDWQAQMYVRSGEDWKLSWGKLYKGLQGGWHRVEINVSDIENPAQVKDIGVQIKNWALEGEVTLYIDEIAAIEQ